ncbi:hypothetical protein [uncultured Chryseobacterium sp.]|uniref:hypothetical protein n=1 Tax=uncultured Chryseobacterium sp. TaxID=259322 RepID=UPI00258C9ECA|nr:hypothetical protein [uncultured Chryseobacterium sp.]
MKKIILLAAFGVAGLVNAKSTVASNRYSKVTEIKRGKGKQSKSIWMYASFYSNILRT